MKDPALESFARSTAPDRASVDRVRQRVERSLREGPPPRRTSPLTWLTWGGAVLATAISALFVSVRVPEPDPLTYAAEPLSGGIVRQRGAADPPVPAFDQDSVVRWVARPARDVADAQVWLRAGLVARSPDDRLRVLEPDLVPSPSGAFVVRGAARAYFGRQPGRWTLYFVVGPRDVLTDAALRSIPEPTDRIAVFESACVYALSQES